MTTPVHDVIPLIGEGGRRFSIFLLRGAGEFTEYLRSVFSRDDNYHRLSHVGVLALDYLKRSGTLIDVGAHIGLISIPAAAYGSQVIAIEMLPENCLCLHLALQANRLRNLAVFQLAAGAQAGLVGFEGSEAWAHVVPSGDGARAAMMTLDEIVDLAGLQRRTRFGSGLRRPLLIKIDTEGSELAVLHGAERTIGRYDPAFLIESIIVEGRDSQTDRNSHAAKSLLENDGYHLYLHRDRFLVPRRASDLQEGHVCDFFASRRQYREGDRIGRFVVRPLGFAESLVWIAEMVQSPQPQHRLHAVGVILRWRGEGRRATRLDELSRALLDDADPAVAEHAARLR